MSSEKKDGSEEERGHQYFHGEVLTPDPFVGSSQTMMLVLKSRTGANELCHRLRTLDARELSLQSVLVANPSFTGWLSTCGGDSTGTGFSAR